jgi:hypothetical protein
MSSSMHSFLSPIRVQRSRSQPSRCSSHWGAHTSGRKVFYASCTRLPFISFDSSAHTRHDNFTVTHPLATLLPSLTQSFSLPARLASKEVVNATKIIWNVAFDDAELDALTLNFQTLKTIHRLRSSRADAYNGFTQNLKPCSFNSHRTVQVHCWKLDLLKRFEEGPNPAAFSIESEQGWIYGKCGQIFCYPTMTHSRPLSSRRPLRSPNFQNCVKRVYHQKNLSP